MQDTRRRELTQSSKSRTQSSSAVEMQDTRRRELTHEQLRLIRNQLGR